MPFRHPTLDVDLIKDIAAERGIDSIAALADRADITRDTLYRVLGGHRKAQPSHLHKLAKALRVKPTAIVKATVEEPAEVAS